MMAKRRRQRKRSNPSKRSGGGARNAPTSVEDQMSEPVPTEEVSSEVTPAAETSRPSWFRKVGKWFALLFLCLFLSSKGLLFYRAKQTLAWPTTTGKPISAEVVTRTEYHENSQTVHYVPTLEYSYTVDGKSYKGRRLAYNRLEMTSRAWAQALIDHLRRNGSVVVYYSPHKPSRAVLVPGVPRFDSNYMWLLGLCMIVVSGLGLAAVNLGESKHVTGFSWLARHRKLVFGVLFFGSGMLFWKVRPGVDDEVLRDLARIVATRRRDKAQLEAQKPTPEENRKAYEKYVAEARRQRQNIQGTTWKGPSAIPDPKNIFRFNEDGTGSIDLGQLKEFMGKDVMFTIQYTVSDSLLTIEFEDGSSIHANLEFWGPADSMLRFQDLRVDETGLADRCRRELFMKEPWELRRS